MRNGLDRISKQAQKQVAPALSPNNADKAAPCKLAQPHDPDAAASLG